MEKLVSIVLPVYNGEKYLAQSIESVLNQTYKNFELIIVNDCSTDSSEEIILKYKKQDSRIVYIKNQVNSKLPKSLNNGFKIARGEYYTWTSDDNMYHNDAIEEMVNFLDENTDVALVFCDFNKIDENGVFKDKYISADKCNLIYWNIIGACFMYRSSAAKELGEYREDMFLAEDYEYWLRMNLNYKIAPLHKCLYEYRQHMSNLSSTKKQEVKNVTGKLHWEYLKKYEKSTMSEREVIKYFEYILMYKPKFIERVCLEVVFAFRHKKYAIEIMQKFRGRMKLKK